jgi:hypothetical protein
MNKFQELKNYLEKILQENTVTPKKINVSYINEF